MMQRGVISLVVISDFVRPFVSLHSLSLSGDSNARDGIADICANSQACPWCYIGQRELQKAIRDVAEYELTIKVEHRPFLLHPSMEEDKAVDKWTWYLEKFGKEKFEQIQSMVSSRAKEVGVDM